MSLFAELQRRNVIKVGAFYLVASWLLIQVAETVLPLFEVPEAFLRGIVVLLALGFVPALVLAWVYELTPEGIRKDAGAGAAPSVDRGSRLSLATTLIAILAIALFAWDRVAGPTATNPKSEMTGSVSVSAPGPAPISSDARPEGSAAQDEPVVDDGVSIAVLPFANMSGDPDNEYFSDGLTDTLLHVLAKVPELRVAARTSSFKFKNKAEDINLIGEQLRVGHVLEGSVQRSRDRVRITAQLIKTEDGYNVWTETYDRTLDDIFEVQDEIATNVVKELTSTLLGQVSSAEPIDADVFDDFLRAQALVNSSEADRIDDAVILLESIVQRAPEFGRGYALLTHAHVGQVDAGEALPENIGPLARAAAERAVEIAPDEADTWLALATISGREGRHADRLAATEKALALEPNGARVLAEYANALRRMNRFSEALPITRRAVLLDPLNNQLKPGLAEAYFYTNQYGALFEMLETALEDEPEDPVLLDAIADFHWNLGQWAEAVRYQEQLIALNPRSFNELARLFDIYRGLGDLETASAILERMSALSEERALDEGAELCLHRNDRACYVSFGKRYAEAREGDRSFILGQVAYLEGDLEEAIVLQRRHLAEEEAQGDVRTGMERANLAALLHRQGRFDERDTLLAEAEEILGRALAQGIRWVRLTHYFKGAIAAARGDAAEAVALARVANREGRPLAVSLIWDQMAWDVIRDTPEFRELMVEVEKRQAELLAEVRDVAMWDPRKPDELEVLEP